MSKQLDSLLEDLTRLYLRLNGFVNQNLIIHSEKNGASCGELDMIGIRLPYHSQNDREVPTSECLEVSTNRIQVIIGDCKNYNKKEDLEYSPIRKNIDCIKKLINWIGFQEKEDEDLLDKFNSYLNIHKNKTLKGFPRIELDTQYAKFDIKFIFFCPALEKWDGNGFKYIHGQEIIDYIYLCLNKLDDIEECSRTYNFENWNNYEWIIRYFKERSSAGTVKDFEYNYLKYYDKYYR